MIRHQALACTLSLLNGSFIANLYQTFLVKLLITSKRAFSVTFLSYFMVNCRVLAKWLYAFKHLQINCTLPPAILVICHSSHMLWLMMWYKASQCQPTSDWDTGCVEGTRWAFRRMRKHWSERRCRNSNKEY